MLEPNSVDTASKISGISKDRIDSLAKTLCDAKNVTIIAGELVTSSSHREMLSAAIGNLALLANVYQKGQVGFLSKYSNSKGAEKLGILPHLPAYLKSKMKELWGFYPENEGLAADRMILAAKKEEIDSLLVIGSDLLSVYPDGQFIREGLRKLDFLVVADLFETETTELADVVLPLSSWAEYEGEFINLEGTVQHFESAIKPIENSLPAREIINKIASAMEKPIYDSPQQLQSECNTLLSLDAKEEPPSKLSEVKFVGEKVDPNFPLPLFVSDDLHHFGHLTERSKSLSAFCNEPYVEISPSMAEKLQISAGTMVKVESEVGKVILSVKISENFDNDIVLISRNFATTPVNILQMRKRRIDRVKLSKVEE